MHTTYSIQQHQGLFYLRVLFSCTNPMYLNHIHVWKSNDLCLEYTKQVKKFHFCSILNSFLQLQSLQPWETTFPHPSQENAKIPLNELCIGVNSPETANLEMLFIIAGDFNQANFMHVLSKYHQSASYTTEGVNTLDQWCNTIKYTFCPMPCHHFGQSVHLLVLSFLAYSQRL